MDIGPSTITHRYTLLVVTLAPSMYTRLCYQTMCVLSTRPQSQQTIALHREAVTRVWIRDIITALTRTWDHLLSKLMGLKIPDWI